MNRIGIETARGRLGDIVNAAQHDRVTTVITRNGRDVAAVVPADSPNAVTDRDGGDMHVWAIDLSGVPRHQLARVHDYLKGVQGWAEGYLGQTPLDDEITIYIYVDADDTDVVDLAVGRLARRLPERGGSVTIRVRGARIAQWSITYRTGLGLLDYIEERKALRAALAPAGAFLADWAVQPKGCETVVAPDGVDVAAIATAVLGESARARVTVAAPALPGEGEGA